MLVMGEVLGADTFWQFGHNGGFVPSNDLKAVWDHAPTMFRSRLYHPDNPAEPHLALDQAFKALATAVQPAPAGLVPVTYVDDRSLACVVCQPEFGALAGTEGTVVRWHLDDIPERHQGSLLDINAWDFALSIMNEDKYLARGLQGMKSAARKYRSQFVDKNKTAKPEQLRPFRLACQNVIVGLGAMRHDDATNAHVVRFWQACDVPHVATFEGVRALTVLMLCDAFQSGGTMELDFTQHPEKKVPAVLARYGRTLGLQLGAELQTSISPAEARELFLAVTPMPPELLQQVKRLADQGEVTVEALCYSLLSPIWRPIELDFILACSSRAGSMLQGGAQLTDPGRIAEHEIGRAARMLGVLYERLNNKDSAAPTEDNEGNPVRVFDDRTHGVTWSVLPEFGAVRFTGLPDGEVPWQDYGPAQSIKIEDGGDLIAVPRANPIDGDFQTMQELAVQFPDAHVVAVIPAGTWLPTGLTHPVLTFPDRLNKLDETVVSNLLKARQART